MIRKPSKREVVSTDLATAGELAATSSQRVQDAVERLNQTVNDNAALGNFRLRSIGIGASASYAEKPTVTYQPLKGEKFVKQVLSPVPADTLLLLYHSGWSIDRLCRLIVTRLDDLKNAPSASGPTPVRAPEFEAFQAVCGLLRDLQQRDVIHLAKESGGEGRVVLQVDAAHSADPSVVALREALRLAPGQHAYPLDTDVSARKDPARIHVATRSLMGVLYYLSQAVEAPAMGCALFCASMSAIRSGAAHMPLPICARPAKPQASPIWTLRSS